MNLNPTPDPLRYKKISRSRALPNPNKYILMLLGEYSEWAYDEERAPLFKGKWRSVVFKTEDSQPMDLEIGVGNGFFFADYTANQPQRKVLGLEIKYKPLIQTVRRALAKGAQNFRVLRYNAHYLEDLIGPGELNNVFIYYPDPWAGREKHRLITEKFLNKLFELQRPGTFLEFKTDHPEYFQWVIERVPQTPYRLSRVTDDLYNSEWLKDNFATHFEKLWRSKGLKSHLIRLEK